MRLPPLLFPALIALVGCGIACSAPVMTQPAPPVKTRPVQEVPPAAERQPAPPFPTGTSPHSRSSEAETHGGEQTLIGGGSGQDSEERQEEAKDQLQIVGTYFDAQGFHEDDIGGHHEHSLVTLAGINLFVIRAGHIYKNPVERAKAVARLLEESLHVGDPLFILGKDGNDPALYAVSHHGGYPRLILTVTRSDALGYSRRRSRPVSPEELGQWWLWWLEDLIAVLLLGKPPSSLPTTRAQETLILLQQRLRELSPQGPYTHAQVVTAVESLSDETRHTLQSQAFNVRGVATEEETVWGDSQ